MTTEWTRAKQCESNACVEATVQGDLVLMRDSKDPDGTVLEFSIEAWKELVTGGWRELETLVR